MHKPKVFLGISGGVDSAVAAYLLQQQGYDVEAVFMKNWEEDDDTEYCLAAQDLQDAKSVCEKLKIKLHSINFAAEYWDYVFEHFLSEYKQGRTPNPDILCNREIKFKAFLNYALELGADYIATGHYAKIIKNNNVHQLHCALDSNKDQSYFLYALNGDILSKVIFPLADICKPDVRKIAAQLGLNNASKKDSTGICFIGERKFKDFLERFIPANPGNIVDKKGNKLGQHDGLMYYTIGQRKGLGIGGVKELAESPWYVVAKNLSDNTLLVSQNPEDLMQTSLVASQLNWINASPSSNIFSCEAKIRYRQASKQCKCTLLDNGNWQVEFATTQRAVTPGQSIVFYEKDRCLGGGIIN